MAETFFDQSIMNLAITYKNIRKITIGQRSDNKAGWLLTVHALK